MLEKDVKIGMKVVPHSKYNENFETWKNHCHPANISLKENGFITVDEKRMGYFVCDGDYFHASDFEPYIERKKQKFGGYFEGNKTVVYVNGVKGEANCNPDDTYSTPYGLLLAYCRATGADTAIVDMLFKKPEEKTTHKFKVGDLVTASKNAQWSWLTYYVARIKSIGLDGTYYLEKVKNLKPDNQWNTYSSWDEENLKLYAEPVTHSVIIDGVHYVKEESNA